ncbi:glycosyltransferase family 2 protein [Lacinutrix venerupis]|uniref:Glycosyltransferase 2-like domain-containing protein n=1 Tax=Lacinutrix venerupis TaxID=1486034 RepID=A0AAC9LPJ9_9FLAO|nr:glycosyltransferase family 2 protein [Lacinutrix venerupis]APY01383.1 hypothetical protein BWR22_14090 [Lacinutrix venerupis]
MPLISIILCTFNGEAYLKAQIDSILNQTYKSIELIVCDDKSTDNTISILNAYAQKDSRIKVNSNLNNLGYIKNFEKGIALATGEYIALSDQDDVWALDKIEKLYNNIKDYDLIYCDSLFVDKNLKSLNKKMSSSKNMISSNNPLHFALDNCVSGHALLFKKQLCNTIFPFPKLIPHDWWIAFNATLNGGITYFNEALVDYRIHDNNTLVLNKNRKSKENKIYKRQARVLEFYKKCPEHHYAKKILLNLELLYKKPTAKNNFKKIALFLKHKEELFIIKKKKSLALIFYILKLYNKIK